MVIDTSAIIAILLREPEADELATFLIHDAKRLLSAFNAFEVAAVISARKGPSGVREFDLFLHHTAIEIVPLTADHVLLARQAYLTYGKGRHPASLNLGDCCSYALSKFSGESLLFKGMDFLQTDIIAVSS
ncbi:MAG: type II toxin-antitoxin system VapC family toxin [Deltaproteobacteria bacterium]|nr:type II toxin-antitoxin system VapC family toxin [Deltaproteobacteria bacterium]